MAERRAPGPVAEEPDFLQFNDLACESVGGKVVFASDEWFAPAANLLKREPPQFIASAFTEFGKWMDGWETRRKRTPGHDWCIVQLGVPGLIHGVDVDTSFFTGNHSPYVSVQAGCLNQPPDFTLEGDRTGMAASDSQLAAVAKADQRGILQVPGWEWAVFRLGHPGEIRSIEVDTRHFKGNFPDCCRLEARSLSPEEEAACFRTGWNSGKWQLLLPPQKLRPHHRHLFESELTLSRPVSHVRLIISPDGGVSRLRLWGRATPIAAAPANQQRAASKL
ncbi:Allantoicase [Larimichthys crocea]|uniref:Uncharacterized protein n=1 Tax=Larimichthys crocea TaxID=215358 RepID=A0ACD3QZ23_LARCR|nr:Allantoicase [Larimichthys crocea]